MLMKDLIGIDNENSALKLKKTVQENELVEVNKKLPSNNPISINELSKITDEFFSHPSKNIDIIKAMRERYPRKLKEKDNNKSIPPKITPAK